MRTRHANAYMGVNTRVTSQSQPILGREQDMAPNNAGGFSFVIDKWRILDRFLVLGSEGGTYYVSERKLTLDSAKNLLECIRENGVRVVNRIVEISHSGRAPKNDAALFALAVVTAHGNDEARRAAFAALPAVARIGTHLFHFAAYVEQFRGWGRGLRDAVSNWYTSKTPLQLAQQVTKYAQRDGWSHRDLLRLSHAKATDADVNQVLHYVVKGLLPKYLGDEGYADNAFHYLGAVEAIKNTKNVEFVANMIAEYNLPREVVPTELLNEAVVWDALMQKMPLTAMIRNLATMTRVGVLGPSSKWTKEIEDRLQDVEALRKARIHPINVLQALMTYSGGQGIRGGNTWTPNQRIVDALDGAFYLAFTLVEPTNKRFVLGVDVSGSMGCDVSGIVGMSCRTAAAALAMVIARTERNYHLMGFSHQFISLAISPRQRLDDITNYTGHLPFGGTDCSLPMLWALQNKVEADVFMVLTDNETWAGSMHPMQALRQYRDATGIPAKLVVAAFAPTQFSIADPKDAGSLDVAGFDASVPAILNDFITR